MIKKAEKNEIAIIKAKTKSELRAYYKLYCKTMKKLGSPPHSYKYFDAMWDLFYPKHLLLLLALHNNQYIASSLYFLYKETIHHAYNCSLKEYQRLGQNNLIQWHAIQWGSQNGYKYLDFGRTRDNAGNVLFKQRWGGEIIKMPYFYRFHKKILKQRQEIKYQYISDLWRNYLPEPVANIIGPKIIKQIG